MRNCPAEVDMQLATTYEITVPKDAIAGIATAGLLGETYVEINTTEAVGGPSENYGYLKSKQSKSMAPLADHLRSLDDHLTALDVMITGLASKAKEDSKNNSKPMARPSH
jgi:ABC-type transporter Mla subunit MlaD